MTRRHLGLIAASVLALGLFGTVTVNSTRWIGTTFPGFFVMANRVVPSIALPGWRATERDLFQHQVIAVEDVSVRSARDVYELVGHRAPGTPIRYRLRAPDGTITTQTIAARRFLPADYGLIFGAYLLNGIAFAAIGLLMFTLRPDSPVSLAVLSIGLAVGGFVLTATDLYGPHWFFRLHVLGECAMAPALIHLALVFPRDRLQRRRRVLLAIYVPFVVLALLYECALGWPQAYTFAHLVATATHALGGITMIGTATYDWLTTRTPLIRRRIAVVALGAVAGLLLPTALMSASALQGGDVPLNAAALTAFLFPLSIWLAISRPDLSCEAIEWQVTHR